MCFGVTVVLLLITLFIFMDFNSSDYILIVIGVLELIGIILNLVQRLKKK